MSHRHEWGSDTSKNASPGTAEERLGRLEHRADLHDRNREEDARTVALLRRELAWQRAFTLLWLALVVLVALAGLALLAGAS